MAGEQFGELDSAGVECRKLPGVKIQPGPFAVVAELNCRLCPDPAFGRLRAVSGVLAALTDVIEEEETAAR
jgi:hypothetical protein